MKNHITYSHGVLNLTYKINRSYPPFYKTSEITNSPGKGKKNIFGISHHPFIQPLVEYYSGVHELDSNRNTFAQFFKQNSFFEINML